MCLFLEAFKTCYQDVTVTEECALSVKKTRDSPQSGPSLLLSDFETSLISNDAPYIVVFHLLDSNPFGAEQYFTYTSAYEVTPPLLRFHDLSISNKLVYLAYIAYVREHERYTEEPRNKDWGLSSTEIDTEVGNRSWCETLSA